ncbi:MAG: site-specific integrase [Chloroflexota bacterium]|nr:site-specific integrase [Chloroflexota bacterium]
MRRPEFPLADAIAWFLEDARSEVVETTWNTYRSHLNAFCKWLPERDRTLAHIEPEAVERFVRATGENVNTRRNKVIALKSLATYLAGKRLWYAGTDDMRFSVLREVKAPTASAKGLPGYLQRDIVTMVHAVAEGPNALRNAAVVWVELHGLRAKEVRMLLLRNVVLPRFQDRGEFIIEAEAGTKRGTNGVRTIPIEPLAVDPIREYVRRGRAAYIGTGDEPLFLTDDGRAFTREGWAAMAQRLRRRLALEGIAFKQHRLRSTCARRLHEAGYPDSAIMEILGWSSMAMLRRYLGKIPVAQLKRYPTTLERVFGRVV